MQINAGILTISDRASRGQYDDLGGPALQKAANGYGWKIVADALVPDEKREIQRAIREHIARGCNLVLTTGGTGVALRDVTPEATRAVIERELPGFGEIMRMKSYEIVPTAILSRAIAGTRGHSLIINLPGSPRAIGECLPLLMPAIIECLDHLGWPRPVLKV